MGNLPNLGRVSIPSEDTVLIPRSALRPKILTVFRGYSREAFLNDLMAGGIVGIVALPLAIAFAIASGVSPERGLITAVVAGFIISLLSGSRVHIGGPTGAFVVVVYAVIQKHGLDGLMISTFMAGGILVIMGMVGFGSLIKFIPRPVTVGFTSGIAVIIFSSQIRDLFGLRMTDVPADFFGKWSAYGHAAGSFNLIALALAVGCGSILLFWPKISTKIPGSLIALIASTLIVLIFRLPVETIGSRFGSIPSAIPIPKMPHLEWGMIRELVSPAFTIALLSGIESLLSATVSDGMIGGKHRSNMELVAQGVANLVSPLFGGIPATGAIARTATNVKNGGRTPVAGIVHALTLLLIMLVLGRWAVLIPLCSLAAILIFVAYHMSEWRTFKALLRGPRSDGIVLMTTFTLTVVVDLTVAIEVGMLLAMLLFMKHMSESMQINPLGMAMAEENEKIPEPVVWTRKQIPEGVEVFDVQGALFFGAAQRFEESIGISGKSPRAIIVRIRDVLHIDGTGIYALEQIFHRCQKLGAEFLLAGVQPQHRIVLDKSGLTGKIGLENLLPTLEAALERFKIPR